MFKYSYVFRNGCRQSAGRAGQTGAEQVRQEPSETYYLLLNVRSKSQIVPDSKSISAPESNPRLKRSPTHMCQAFYYCLGKEKHHSSKGANLWKSGTTVLLSLLSNLLKGLATSASPEVRVCCPLLLSLY
jgi:hypothetical protein